MKLKWQKQKKLQIPILQNAQKDAAARSEAMIQEAQTQAAGIKAKAEADIARRRRRQSMTLKMRSAALHGHCRQGDRARDLRRRP